VNDEGGKERSETSGKQKKREYRLESIVERGRCVRRSDLLSSVRRLDYVVSRRTCVCERACRGCTHTDVRAVQRAQMHVDAPAVFSPRSMAARRDIVISA